MQFAKCVWRQPTSQMQTFQNRKKKNRKYKYPPIQLVERSQFFEYHQRWWRQQVVANRFCKVEPMTCVLRLVVPLLR